jgi:hypothetical protein
MSLDPELSQGFWAQGAQSQVQPLSTAVQYGLAPQTERVGRLRQGGYAACNSLHGLCAPIDPLSGRELAQRPCEPPDDVFQCYYTTNPTPARALAMASLSSQPFSSVMQTVYNQPNYGDAVQTFFAGKV